MSAVALYSEDVDETTGKPLWRLTLRCGHMIMCGRASNRPPRQRPCATCKKGEKWRRKDQRKRERKAVGLDTFVFRLRNGQEGPREHVMNTRKPK
jgi:hypothetical protein